MRSVIAVVLVALSAFVVACIGGSSDEPLYADPSATVEAEASGSAATSATPTPRSVAVPERTPAPSFVIESNPSEFSLVAASELQDPTTFFYHLADGELLAIDSDEFFRIALVDGGRHVLLDPSRRQFAPLLLLDLDERRIVELPTVTTPGDILWRSMTTVELSLASPSRPAQQTRHVLDLETLLATPAPAPPLPSTAELEPLLGAELRTVGGDFRPQVSVHAPDGREIASIEGLLRPPLISPTREHLAGLTGTAVVVASAPTWDPRLVELDFPFKETGSIEWSPTGDSLLVAGSAGVFVIDPSSLEPRQVTHRDGKGIYAAWAGSGDRILVHERGYGPLDLVDATTLQTIRSHPHTSVIAEDPTGGDRLLTFGHVCAPDDQAFSLHTIDLVTGTSERLAPTEAGFWTASWSPNGRYVAASRVPGQLTLIDLEGSTTITLGGADGIPARFFPAPAGWANGWLVIRELGGRDRCFV